LKTSIFGEKLTGRGLGTARMTSCYWHFGQNSPSLKQGNDLPHSAP
jgi:hypothetical protein